MLGNTQNVKLPSKLDYEQSTNSFKDVTSSRTAGGPRRTGVLVRQLGLNDDLERMSEQAIFDILPREYNQWTEGSELE